MWSVAVIDIYGKKEAYYFERAILVVFNLISIDFKRHCIEVAIVGWS